jgi:hypothetical protein
LQHFLLHIPFELRFDDFTHRIEEPRMIANICGEARRFF